MTSLLGRAAITPLNVSPWPLDLGGLLAKCLTSGWMNIFEIGFNLDFYPNISVPHLCHFPYHLNPSSRPKHGLPSPCTRLLKSHLKLPHPRIIRNLGSSFPGLERHTLSSIGPMKEATAQSQPRASLCLAQSSDTCNDLVRKNDYFPHFTDKELRAQRNKYLPACILSKFMC